MKFNIYKTKSVPHCKAAQAARKAAGKICTLKLSALKAVQKHTHTHTHTPHGCIWFKQVIDCSYHESLGAIP